MSRFAERAQQILEAATAAAENGESRSEMTILIGSDGAIQMLTDSDWSLDSLSRHHGARAAYRVTGSSGMVRVEGREGSQRCVLESAPQAQIARWLLSA